RKLSRKAPTVSSSSTNASNSAGMKISENSPSRLPSTFWMVRRRRGRRRAMCDVLKYGMPGSEPGCAGAEDGFHLRQLALVEQEHDEVVVRLDHDVVVRDQEFFPAYDADDYRLLRQFDFLEAPADHLR